MSEREILFRGKDLQEQNGWLYGYFYKSDINKRERESGKATLIFTPNCDTFIYVPEYHNSWMVKAETVGQYTGLTDKNGRKIFEGDIVEYNGTIHEVIFCKISGCAFFGITMPDRGEIWNFDGITRADRMEVIGNLHDNPELRCENAEKRLLESYGIKER